METLGLEALINTDIVSKFLVGTKDFKDLPVMWAEIYLNEQNNHDLYGRNNSEGNDFNGLRLICEPMDEDGNAIADIPEGSRT